MKVFRSNSNLDYFQIGRCGVRFSPRKLSFLENSTKDATFWPKSSHFWENFKKTTEYFRTAIPDAPFSEETVIAKSSESVSNWFTFKILSFLGFSIKIRCHGFKKYTLFLLSFVKIYYSVCTDTERGYLF